MNPEELLLRELKSVMDGAGKSIEDEAKSEHLAVLGLISKAIDENHDSGAHIYAIREVPIDEVLRTEAETPDRVLNSHGVTNPRAEGFTGGSVEHLGECGDPTGLAVGLGDHKLMTVICDQVKPAGLLGRSCYEDGSKFTVLATPAFISTERRSADGVTVTKLYDPADGKPEDIDTYKDYEVEAIANIYSGLMLPRRLREEYPETFASLVKDIINKMEGDSDE
jgi:hypothetical protein